MEPTTESLDWIRLCQITDELFAEFGSRPYAFAEACRRNPHLDSTAPNGMSGPAPFAHAEASGAVRTVEQLIAEAEQRAKTDPSLSKEQHFTRLLNENPGAYDEYEPSRAAKKVV
jgi:hypothetical protein